MNTEGLATAAFDVAASISLIRQAQCDPRARLPESIRAAVFRLEHAHKHINALLIDSPSTQEA